MWYENNAWLLTEFASGGFRVMVQFQQARLDLSQRVQLRYDANGHVVGLKMKLVSGAGIFVSLKTFRK